MISIIQFFNEKLTINSKTEVADDTEVLDDICKHFEIDYLLEMKKGYNNPDPFLEKEDMDEIKKVLQKFIKENNISKDSLKYFIRKGYKFKNNKIAKDFNKNNSTCTSLYMSLNFTKDKKEIYKKDSLYFEVSADKGLIVMFGPYGGAKYCTFK